MKSIDNKNKIQEILDKDDSNDNADDNEDNNVDDNEDNIIDNKDKDSETNNIDGNTLEELSELQTKSNNTLIFYYT